MPDYLTKAIMAVIVWSVFYLIPLSGMRSKDLALGLVWSRFKKFLPISVLVAFIAMILGGMMSGRLGAVGSLVASLLSTTWLFLTYVVYRVDD